MTNKTNRRDSPSSYLHLPFSSKKKGEKRGNHREQQSQNHPPETQQPPMSVPRIGNGTQACAACKHHRRKCAPDCILAPYFPHDRQRQFLNCHKLFGVKNITTIIRHLHPPDKDEAMRTIIFQSDVRASDPVGGCYRIIRDLQRQIDFAKAELDLVLQQLVLYRAAATHHQQPVQESLDAAAAAAGTATVAADPLSSYYYQHLLNPPPPPPPPHSYLVQQQYQQHNNPNQDNNNAWLMHDFDSLHVKEDGFDDMKPLLDIHEDGVEVDERSDEMILKEGRDILKEENDSIGHVEDHDLKGAATFFTLTNCNA